MANTLNKFFHSVFNLPNEELLSWTPLNLPSSSSTPQLSDIKLIELEVAEILQHINPRKACGSDRIPSRLLFELVNVIAHLLTSLFNMALSIGIVPVDWKRANTPVYKKDDPTLSSSYRPISVLYVFSTVSRDVQGGQIKQDYPK